MIKNFCPTTSYSAPPEESLYPRALFLRPTDPRLLNGSGCELSPWKRRSRSMSLAKAYSLPYLQDIAKRPIAISLACTGGETGVQAHSRTCAFVRPPPTCLGDRCMPC